SADGHPERRRGHPERGAARRAGARTHCAAAPRSEEERDVDRTAEPRAVQEHFDQRTSVISRRGFLQRAAWFGAAAMAPRTPAYERNGALLAYVGTYSDRGGGIYLFRVDPSNGRLALVKVFPSAVNPTWLAFGPSNRFLYAANEVADFDGGSTGSVSAYAVDTSTGELTAVNTVTSGGAGPAHLSVDPLGQYVFVANYGGGSVAAIPIRSNGSLGAPTHVVSDVTACSPPCPVGAARAAYGPRGHVATSGHDAAHAHMVRMDPAGKQVIADDLGPD